MTVRINELDDWAVTVPVPPPLTYRVHISHEQIETVECAKAEVIGRQLVFYDASGRVVIGYSHKAWQKFELVRGGL